MTAVVVATVMAVLATMAVDRFAGIVVSNLTSPTGLIFHPHSTVTYHTTEFSFTAPTDALGFRDREFSPSILSHDSSSDTPQPKVHESPIASTRQAADRVGATLRHAGTAVEVANLGFPGGSPLDTRTSPLGRCRSSNPTWSSSPCCRTMTSTSYAAPETPPEQRR